MEIAARLNKAAVPPPRASAKSSAIKFWRKSTLTMLISNRTYLGELTFGVKQWGKDPTTRKRRYTKRAANEVQLNVRPDLAIVSEELWNAANARKRIVGQRKTSGRKVAHPFSGLLDCARCQSRMVQTGGGSSTRVYYKCNAAHSGDACWTRDAWRRGRNHLRA